MKVLPSSNPVSIEWRCFHCDEVFADREAAADHFGVQIDGCADDVACKINATDGLLVSMLREAQAELREYHQEDNAAFRQFHALGAEHATALRREEEKGYARGLEDAKKHPETLGLRSADETAGKQPVPMERWVEYYRGILERIARGYDSPSTLAELAVSHVIHTDWCNSKKGEWEECDCAPAFIETPEEPTVRNVTAVPDMRDELFAAWNALNELRHDVEEAESRAFKALDG